MSKVKTCSMISLRPLAYFPYQLPKKTRLSENEKRLSLGVEQRQKVLPQDASLLVNKNKVGFTQPAPKNVATTIMESYNHISIENSLAGRNVKIFLQDTNHMQNVPVQPKGYRWVVQLEREAVFKNPCMGWTMVSDSFSKRVVKFVDLEQAIFYCQKMGYGYQVEYPRFRYHQKKSYADNFKWKGPPKPEDDF